LRYGVDRVDCERQPSSVQVPAKHFFDAAFVDWRHATVQLRNTTFVDVDGNNPATSFRESQRRRQADVPGAADDADLSRSAFR
tara:strand:- start:132 stop:380 length:249 start_codon:yes stop_codon:yes gene_type:complete